MADQVERFIRIEALDVVHSDRQPGARTWQTIANGGRVRVLEYSSLLLQREDGGVDEKRHVFHIRYIDGIHKGSRVTYFGNYFMVRDISESGRLTGLELSCTSAEG
jgi:hypothetical protein